MYKTDVIELAVNRGGLANGQCGLWCFGMVVQYGNVSKKYKVKATRRER